MRILFRILILLVCLSTAAFAQNKMRFSLFGGFVSNGLSNGLNSNWGDGWSIGARILHPLSGRTDLLFEAIYCKLPYKGDNIGLVVPAVAGLHKSISGLPSKIYEASIGTRFIAHGTLIKPFLALHGGLVALNLGDITISEWWETQPRDISRSIYANTDKTSIHAFGSIGTGALLPVAETIDIVIDVGLMSIFGTGQIIVPVSLGCDFCL